MGYHINLDKRDLSQDVKVSYLDDNGGRVPAGDTIKAQRRLSITTPSNSLSP